MPIVKLSPVVRSTIGTPNLKGSSFPLIFKKLKNNFTVIDISPDSAYIVVSKPRLSFIGPLSPYPVIVPHMILVLNFFKEL